jgi:hypothetical protein
MPDEEPFLVTVPNVPILEVGEDWVCSTGTFTTTVEDLQSAVAAQDDPAIRTPVIKFGHTDPRFTGDGDFSVGRICNMRLSPDQQTLIGDYVGVPLWLAKCMSSAYPRRSIEGQWGSTPGVIGPDYDGFFLTALALLGASYPAIATLEDIEAFWKGEPPPMYDAATGEVVPFTTAIAAEAESVPIFRRGDRLAQIEAAVKVEAAAQVDDVRSAYYDSIAADPSKMWWWIRAMYVAPAELIVDDDEGGLWRVPYEITDAGKSNSRPTITFGTPKECQVSYVNIAASAHPIPVPHDETPGSRRMLASWSARPESRPATLAANGETEPNPGGKVVPTDREKLLESLGLAADAGADDIAAALETAKATLGEPSAAGPSNPASPHNPANPGPGTPGAPTPANQPASNPANPANPTVPVAAPQPYDQANADNLAAAAHAAGMVLVDQAAWAEVQEGARVAREMAAAAAVSRRDQAIAAAVKAGKFPKARMEHYTKAWDADPTGTEALIAGLSEGLVPINARGTSAADLVEGGAQPQAAQYPTSWKPARVRAREQRAAAAAGVGNDLGD